jgi:hypothetical protein
MSFAELTFTRNRQQHLAPTFDAGKLSGLWSPFVLITIGNSGCVLLQIGTDCFHNVGYLLVGLTGFLKVTALTWWGIGFMASGPVADCPQYGSALGSRIRSTRIISNPARPGGGELS